MVAIFDEALEPRADEGGCEILGDWFSILVQAILFFAIASALLMKWWCEQPRRLFKIFALDSSKQVASSSMIHFLNILCAMIFSRIEQVSADECAWYWVNIMIDTTLGVGICWAFLKITETVFGYETGHYGGETHAGIDWELNPDYCKWARQIVGWCFIVFMMKVVVVFIMWVIAPFWVRLAIICTHWLTNQQARLVFVMVVTPIVMSVFQFLVQDSFLKFGRRWNSHSESNEKVV
mmetsp:Transcript_129934/g.277458  ORF Transcript_129934/g.277458 Transcript_129934/m.277458 type:complete len:236 (-) Transcript_129934:102-809(-)